MQVQIKLLLLLSLLDLQLIKVPLPGFVFIQKPTFCNSLKGYEMQKVARVKEARKRRGKEQEKGLKQAMAKKQPLPVNMENAMTVRKIRIFFYCVKKTLLHGEPGMTDTDFVDTFLAFQKGVLLLITTFCIIYVFLHALIFYQPV